MRKTAGFTLIEMAMVLMIVGLLLGGMLVPLSAQMDQRNVSDTQKALSDIKEALIGYAIANGRFPCPASDTSNGVESFTATGTASNGNCSNFYNGFVPAATLGVTSSVDNLGNIGFAVDSWGNRIRYAVTQANTKAFTTKNGMHNAWNTGLSPDLLVCSTATGISGSSCASGTYLTSNGVPVVIFSTGKNGPQANGADETANLANNKTFVSHPPTPTFNDLVVWISPNILFNRMVAAGTLP
jgi:prepilin-type N-terminal cleavage/methylation domain-containing protein